MLLSDSEVIRLVSIQRLIDKRCALLSSDDNEVICLSSISAAIEEYLENYVD